MSTLDDNEQLDSLKSFSKKYGSTIISLILIALIAFFGWQYWQKKQLAESQLATAKVQQLMDESAAGDADAFTKLSVTADKIVKEYPDSVQAVQTQLLMAKLAYDKSDYVNAEKALQKVENAKLDDIGLMHIVKLRLAYAQLAQNKFDAALKTLDGITDPAFKATADEARGDIYVEKKDIPNAKKAYQAAWDDLVARQQERQILQIKLESVGVLVDDVDVERPIIATDLDME